MRNLDKVKQIAVTRYDGFVIGEWDRLGLLGKKITIRNSGLALDELISEYDFDKAIGTVYNQFYYQEGGQYGSFLYEQGSPYFEIHIPQFENLRNKGIINIIKTDSKAFLSYSFTPLFHQLWTQIEILNEPYDNGICVYKDAKIVHPKFYEDLKRLDIFSLEFRINELEFLDYDKEKVKQLKEIYNNYIFKKEEEYFKAKQNLLNFEKEIMQIKGNFNNKIVNVLELKEKVKLPV